MLAHRHFEPHLAATTLRELQARMRLALRPADPIAHRARAEASRLPLFGKFDLDHTLAWFRAQIRWYVEAGLERDEPERLNLRCTRCVFGVPSGSAAPERCPMCQAVDAWIHAAPSRSAAVS